MSLNSFVQWIKAVFFNLFAAVELSANNCVAHGSPRNDPTVSILLS